MYITVEVPCRSTTRELLVKELFSPTNMKKIVYRYDISDNIDACSATLDKFLKHFRRF